VTTVFVDCETICLDAHPQIVTVWEIGLIRRTPTGDREYLWQVSPDMSYANPEALRVGRFKERMAPELLQPSGKGLALGHGGTRGLIPLWEVAGAIAELTDGADLWGSNPAFDMRHLTELLRVCECEPSWHYHPNDTPSVARGWCAAKGITPVSAKGDGRIRSDDWSRAIGVDPAEFDRHTALGDCQWVRAPYNRLMPLPIERTQILGFLLHIGPITARLAVAVADLADEEQAWQLLCDMARDGQLAPRWVEGPDGLMSRHDSLFQSLNYINEDENDQP